MAGVVHLTVLCTGCQRHSRQDYDASMSQACVREDKPVETHCPFCGHTRPLTPEERSALLKLARAAGLRS